MIFGTRFVMRRVILCVAAFLGDAITIYSAKIPEKW